MSDRSSVHGPRARAYARKAAHAPWTWTWTITNGSRNGRPGTAAPRRPPTTCPAANAHRKGGDTYP
jgi:hypothetical protein